MGGRTQTNLVMGCTVSLELGRWYGMPCTLFEYCITEICTAIANAMHFELVVEKSISGTGQDSEISFLTSTNNPL